MREQEMIREKGIEQTKLRMMIMKLSESINIHLYTHMAILKRVSIKKFEHGETRS